MTTLGHDRFGLAGHDRGSYVAYRTALDHPGRVDRLAVLDSVPILEALERTDARFAELWWHWFFFTSEHVERVITADPLAWYRPDRDRMGAENCADTVAAVWAPWCEQPVRSAVIDSGHHMAEEAPEQLAATLTAFFARPAASDRGLGHCVPAEYTRQ